MWQPRLTLHYTRIQKVHTLTLISGGINRASVFFLMARVLVSYCSVRVSELLEYAF